MLVHMSIGGLVTGVVVRADEKNQVLLGIVDVVGLAVASEIFQVRAYVSDVVEVVGC